MHGACTIIFVVVAAAIAVLIGSIQTLDRISWITWVGMTGLMAAIFTMTIAVGVQDRPTLAPQTGPWSTGVVAVGSPSFVDATAALTSIIFSYAGPPIFLPVYSEMRDTTKFVRSLAACQVIVIATFMICSSVVYHFCGIYVATPALGSAGPLLKKVSVLKLRSELTHRFATASHFLACSSAPSCLSTFPPSTSSSDSCARPATSCTPPRRTTWCGSKSSPPRSARANSSGTIAFNAALSFLVAEAIPVFSDLLSLIGAALATPLCMTMQGAMFIWLNRKDPNPRTAWRTALNVFNVSMILVSLFAIGGGWYASVVQINKSVRAGGTTQPFSCADNSNSV